MKQKNEKQRKSKKRKRKRKRNQRIKLAWDTLRCDAETGMVVKSKRKWEEDMQRRHCREWWGAWKEAGMKDDEFQWLPCVGCEEWWCPKCVILEGLLKDHEPQ